MCYLSMILQNVSSTDMCYLLMILQNVSSTDMCYLLMILQNVSPIEVVDRECSYIILWFILHPF